MGPGHCSCRWLYVVEKVRQMALERGKSGRVRTQGESGEREPGGFKVRLVLEQAEVRAMSRIEQERKQQKQTEEERRRRQKKEADGGR